MIEGLLLGGLIGTALVTLGAIGALAFLAFLGRQRGKKTMSEYEDLKTTVESTEGVIASAKSLIDGIAARIQAAVDAATGGQVPVGALEALATGLKASSDALAAAVAANQPAAPPAPPATPEPAPEPTPAP